MKRLVAATAILGATAGALAAIPFSDITNACSSVMCYFFNVMCC